MQDSSDDDKPITKLNGAGAKRKRASASPAAAKKKGKPTPPKKKAPPKKCVGLRLCVYTYVYCVVILNWIGWINGLMVWRAD